MLNKQYFIDAADLIRKGFCRGYYARDSENGRHVALDTPEAKCFCMMGAFKKVTWHLPNGGSSRPDLAPYYGLMWDYAKDKGYRDITELNDNPVETPDAEAAAKHLETLASMCDDRPNN